MLKSVLKLIIKGFIRYSITLSKIVRQAAIYPLGVPNCMNKLLKYTG